MPTLAVVFDTNIYRGMSLEGFDDLREQELARKVRPIASYYVVVELLAHLADPDDPSYGAAFYSLGRLWERSKIYDGSHEGINRLQPMDDQLAMSLFGRPIATLDTGGFWSLAGSIVNDDISNLPSRYGDQLTKIADFVASAEADFIDSLWDALRVFAPQATSWQDLAQNTELRTEFLLKTEAGEGLIHIAEAFVLRTASQLDVELSPDELSEKRDMILEGFPLPIHLYDRIIRKVVETGQDMSKRKRANSLWDLQICFSTGRDATLAGAPLWLVTNDKPVIEAAKVAGTRANVKSLSEYSDILRLKWSDYRKAITIESR